MSQIKITVLIEDTAGKFSVNAEHGLSYLIEIGGKKTVFDTGQGFVLKHNLERLNIDLRDVTSIALSHGHYDHTGGLSTALSLMNSPKIYAHSSVTEQKFSRNPDGSGRYIGISEKNREALLSHEWIKSDDATTLPCGLSLTGQVPRKTEFEDTGGTFYLDKECTKPDLILDDQSAFFETECGTVVILGCAHSGIINTLTHIQELTDGKPIHTVVGGTHLCNASDKRIDKTIEKLRELNIKSLFPCHCTGLNAVARIWNEFPGQVHACPVGTVISL